MRAGMLRRGPNCASPHCGPNYRRDASNPSGNSPCVITMHDGGASDTAAAGLQVKSHIERDLMHIMTSSAMLWLPVNTGTFWSASLFYPALTVDPALIVALLC